MADELMADLASAIVEANAAGDEGRVAALSAEIAVESGRRWEQLPAARRAQIRQRMVELVDAVSANST